MIVTHRPSHPSRVTFAAALLTILILAGPARAGMVSGPPCGSTKACCAGHSDVRSCRGCTLRTSPRTAWHSTISRSPGVLHATSPAASEPATPDCGCRANDADAQIAMRRSRVFGGRSAPIAIGFALPDRLAPIRAADRPVRRRLGGLLARPTYLRNGRLLI
jgi:hypothetical protein